MDFFEKKPIIESSQVIARELRQAREARGLCLADVAEILKMNVNYLAAMERGNFSQLPTGIYKVNFLREYVLFLGLPLEEFLDLFEDSQRGQNILREEDLFVRKAGNVRFSLTIPKLMKNLLILSASAVCLTYLAFSINDIVAPPELSIDSPSLDTITEEKEIMVRGTTVPEAEVHINDELVLADKSGVFEKKVELRSGLNTIVISAQKKYSRVSEQVKKVLVSGG
jgi:cytoskeletal protein RodZ